MMIDFTEFEGYKPALLTVAQLAKTLGVSVDAVDRGIEDGTVPVIRLRATPTARRYVPSTYVDRIHAIGRGEVLCATGELIEGSDALTGVPRARHHAGRELPGATA